MFGVDKVGKLSPQSIDLRLVQYPNARNIAFSRKNATCSSDNRQRSIPP